MSAHLHSLRAHPLILSKIFAAVGVTGALCMILHLEWNLAEALGMPSWLLWSPSAAIEAYTILAVLGGSARDVAGALTLTWCSGVIGLAHAASERARITGQPLNLLGQVSTLALVTLVVCALIGVHRALERSRRAVASAQAAHLRAQAAHDAQVSAQAAAAEQRERSERAVERSLAAQLERARIDAQAEAEIARTRAYTEQELGRLRLEAAREGITLDTPVRTDEVAEQRVKDQWVERERSGKPMTGEELAGLLGVSPATGRRTANKWRRSA